MRRFSSRIQRLDRSFLTERLRDARAYDRIAGYFSSSLLEVAGEEIESISGPLRIVCNSQLEPQDVVTARAAANAQWQEWTASQPEALVAGAGESAARHRFGRLFDLLQSGKLRVRVLPDAVFGLIHGKAGVITLADGRKTSFLGSANESRSAWQMNYELLWEDESDEAVAWVQAEFDALWGSPSAVPLAAAVVQDVQRIAQRTLLTSVEAWRAGDGPDALDPAPVVIEAPVYRREVGLWAHQKWFVKTAFDAHVGPLQKARFVLADQVGLGKTLQLAMAAQLMALTGERPVLIICPKPLVWQWQNEMNDLLDLPAAVWDGKRWVDEQGVKHAVNGATGVRKCPRRVGIVSSGLIKRRSAVADELLKLQYECVILDEAHHARRRNLGDGRDGEAPDANNLLRFMWEIAERTRSLLLATATPVQLRPVEAWDLLDILSRGDGSVLGDATSRWRHAEKALALLMDPSMRPSDEVEQWDWLRNPFPPKTEHLDYEVLRNALTVPDSQSFVHGWRFKELTGPNRQRVRKLFPTFVREHNPFIRRIVRRTREQLEKQLDPETGEPFLKRIGVELHGEDDAEAITLPLYLRDAYKAAEAFSALLGKRLQSAGFLKTLLLRRIGSTIYAGKQTAHALLDNWESIEDEDDEELESDEDGTPAAAIPATSRALTTQERQALVRVIEALEANQERDPKVAGVIRYLRDYGWLEPGCIVFSQYRHSIQWLADQLTVEFPNELIGLYSGPSSSGLMQNGRWTPTTREQIKEMVRTGQMRLLLGTDAASEGLNLQKLARLINLDLPWNPTRLEQRKGRIQRIGQVHETVHIYNMRYKDSVEDRVHQLLSQRLQGIYQLFGQLPDVLESAWVAEAMGDQEEARRVIDAVPVKHPFELRYTRVEAIDWESCRTVLDASAKREELRKPWG